MICKSKDSLRDTWIIARSQLDLLLHLRSQWHLYSTWVNPTPLIYFIIFIVLCSIFMPEDLFVRFTCTRSIHLSRFLINLQKKQEDDVFFVSRFELISVHCCKPVLMKNYYHNLFISNFYEVFINNFYKSHFSAYTKNLCFNPKCYLLIFL